VTYVHDEAFLLQIWLRYYLRHFSGEDIFILDHNSPNASYLEHAKALYNVHVTRIADDKKTFFPLVALITAVQHWTHLLLERRHPCVLVAEVDEIVAPNPRFYPGGLGQFLSAYAADTAGKHFPLTMLLEGKQLAHISQGSLKLEPPLNWSANIMAQRSYWATDGHFDKPYLTKQKLHFDAGGHSAKGFNGTRLVFNFSFYGLLKLIHLHHADRGHCEQRMAWKVADALASGVQKVDRAKLGVLGYPEATTKRLHARNDATVGLATDVNASKRLGKTERSSKWCGYAFSHVAPDGSASAFVEYDTTARHRWHVSSDLQKIDSYWKQVVI